MSSTAPLRRGFLRSLASLPLIGGGVTLLGNPTAAAVPVSPELLDCYDTWLHAERRRLRWERYGPNPPAGDRLPVGLDLILYDRERKTAWDYVAIDNAAGRFHDWGLQGPAASGRAAVVLATVGCDWREEA